MLWLAVAASVSMTPLSFVGQLHQALPRGVEFRTTLRVRERRVSSGKSADEAEARLLTKRITGAQTAADLIAVLDLAVDDPSFNFFHASASFHRLARLHREDLLPRTCAESPVVVKLQARVKNMIMRNQLNPQASGNVLWAMEVLCDAVPSVTQLLSAMAKTFATKATGMDAQGLSNCLWALAQLKDAKGAKGVVLDDVVRMVRMLATEIRHRARDMKPQELANCLWASAHLKKICLDDVVKIVSALGRQIPIKVRDMKPQELANSVWASGELKDVFPDDVVKIVPALVTQIPNKAEGMKVQELSNSLQGLVLLQDLVPEVRPLLNASSEDSFMRSTAVKFSKMLPTLSGSDLRLAVPVVVWACARSEFRFEPLLMAVARRLNSSAQVSTFPDWGLCALAWFFQMRDKSTQFEDFQQVLQAEVMKRGLSDSDVERSRVGFPDWSAEK